MKQSLLILMMLGALGCKQTTPDHYEKQGSYQGIIEYGNFSDRVNFEIEKDTTSFNVFFTSLAQNAFRIPLQNISVNGDSICFELRSDFYTYRFKNLWMNKGTELQSTLYVDTVSVDFVLSKESSQGGAILKEDDVLFTSGGLTLNGTIWYPDNPNKKGMVLLTSSGNADRSASRAEAMLFAQSGYTAFHYDKRGTGNSEGDWNGATMEDLLSDDINAIRFFAESTGLALTSIGIKGSSQGAAKVPFILNELSDLKYGIVVSCPGVSLLESDLNYWKHRNATKLHKDLEEAAAFQRKVFEFIAGDITRMDLESLIAEARLNTWFENIWIPNLDEVQIDKKLNYNPIPYFEKTMQPILIIQGTADEIIPLNSYENISNALKKAPNSNFQTTILEGANHSMYFIGESDFQYWSKLHPDYFSIIENWIQTID